MEQQPQQFSVEELAYVLTSNGHHEIMRSIMTSAFGEEQLTGEHVEQRLLAAVHSLMARNLIRFGADNILYIDEGLVRLADVLVRAEYTVRFNTIFPQGQLTVGFHRAHNSWFEHRLSQGVVHQFTEFSEPDHIVHEGVRFLDPPQQDWQAPSVDLPGTFFDMVNAEDGMLASRLRQAGVPAEIATMLAEDTSNPQYQGSVMLIEYDSNREAVSDYGFLLLQGPERLWILKPRQHEGNTVFTLLPGAVNTVEAEIWGLLDIRI